MEEAWPATVAEAKAVQETLRHAVETGGAMPPLDRVVGVDVHYAPRLGLAWGAVVVLDGGSLDVVETAMAAVPVSFPYVPGYLSFREAPAALAALRLLADPPTLLLVDGQGLAHPRRFGIACHLGVLTGLPTIGVAKSRLTGRYEEPGDELGAGSPLTDRTERIGTVLRTRTGARPVFVSVGHRVGLDDAVDLVTAFTRGYRLPEPVRLADRLSRLHPL